MSENRIVKRSLWDRRRGKTDWARVDALTDAEIEAAIAADPDAAPILDAEFWKNAVLVPPPAKQPVSLRLDPDVLDFFRESGRGYQTRINTVLRAYMNQARKRVVASQAVKGKRKPGRSKSHAARSAD